MLVRFNSFMRRIMGDALDNLDTIQCELPPDFVAELKKMRIIEDRGVVMVEGASYCDGNFVTDPVGLECSANHYHIDSPGDGSLRASAIAGIVAGKEFKRMIEATKIPGDFRVIVSANYNEHPNRRSMAPSSAFTKSALTTTGWATTSRPISVKEY